MPEDSLFPKPSDGRSASKEQRCLDTTLQYFPRMCNVWHRACELKGSHHEGEDGCRAATGCWGARVGKQCSYGRDEASKPNLIGLPCQHRLSGNFGKQGRRRASAPRIIEMGLAEVASNRPLKIEACLQTFLEAVLLLGERARYSLANEFLLGIKMGVKGPIRQSSLTHDPANARSRDSLPSKAFRGHRQDVLPCCRLVTFFEAHLLDLQSVVVVRS